jgi:5-methylcytosine-specific restriction endonuclease McrA
VRERDGNNCRICGVNTKQKYNLKPDVHHIVPADYWIVEDEHEKMNNLRNLISLCKACHKPLEGKFKGRNHEEFEELAKDYLDINNAEDKTVKQSLFDY